MEQRNKILIVDDNVELVKLMEFNLSLLGFHVLSAFDGEEALKKIDEAKPDLILLDITMPKMDGYEVCRRIKENKETRLIPVVLITALGKKEEKIKGLEAGANDFLTKPVDESELIARINALIKLKTITEELESVENILFTLVNVIDAKDSYTRGHSERVTRLAVLLAERLGLSKEQINTLEKAAQLHDIGKIGIPEAVLNKPGALTNEEFEEVKTHSPLGEKICSPLKTLQPLLDIIRHHHERYDGKGYPDGLKGEEISIEARIIAVVDSYDAMASDRPYRERLSKEAIINNIKKGSGSQWDKNVAEAFLRILEENII